MKKKSAGFVEFGLWAVCKCFSLLFIFVIFKRPLPNKM